MKATAPAPATVSTPAAAAADEPVGNPPAGGSWEWREGAWQRAAVPQTTETQPTEE